MSTRYAKRHYEDFAALLHAHLANSEKTGEMVQRESVVAEIAEHVAALFARDNPRFNRTRFKTACGFGASAF